MKNDIKSVENRIKEDYFNLWNKTKDSPFIAKDMEKLYLNSNELVIIDPDFQVTNKDLNTRQKGFDSIFPLLTTPWDHIESGGIERIDSIELRALGEYILASIEAKGTLRFKDGTIHHLDRKATQVWQLSRDRWIICYEHVS